MGKYIRKYILLFATIFMLVPQASLAESSHIGCTVCGMYTDVYQHTATHLKYKDGNTAATCGVACLMRLINDQGGPDAFTELSVRGWTTKKMLQASEATYVIGSKIVPDMLPNLIAFSSREAAENFQKENGGDVLSFTQALLSISPMGMTMPVKLQSAVVPAKGATGFGVGYMYMKMDERQQGSDGSDPLDYIKQASGMMPMAAKEMTTQGEMAMLTYGVTDDLAMALKLSTLQKRMEMYKKKGTVISTTVEKNSGISDLDLTLRYNLWRNNYYSKFFSLLGGVTLPTGDFDTTYLTKSGLQLGTGDFTGTAGIMYSQRFADFWFHSMLSYTHKLENSDNYKFGDETRFGAALHYTPNFDLMFGLEINGTEYEENEFNGLYEPDSGGFRSYGTGVINWRFLTVWGGNLNLRLAAGLPIYEDMDGIQLGGGYFTNATLSFKRRFSF